MIVGHSLSKETMTPSVVAPASVLINVNQKSFERVLHTFNVLVRVQVDICRQAWPVREP